MTKKQFAKFALNRGRIARYSGKLKKHFLGYVNFYFEMKIHALINQKAYTGESILNSKPLINL